MTVHMKVAYLVHVGLESLYVDFAHLIAEK